MIHMLQGVIAAQDEQAVVVECGPVSFQVAVPQPGLFKLGSPGKLYTYLHWNQEQGPSLFGFSQELERTVFLMIISCSGLGPKIALAILADLGPKEFLNAVHTGNQSALTKVSGIGGKKAEQVIVHLKHKVAKLLETGAILADSGSLAHWTTVSQALQSLNYSKTEVAAVMNHLHELPGVSSMPFDLIMRNALSFLAKKS